MCAMNLNSSNPEVKVCRRCLYDENHPLGITFDEDGVCSGCRIHEEKLTLDWNDRLDSLKSMTRAYLSPGEKHWTLEEKAKGYQVGMPGGLYYDFDTNGVLKMIHDPWGNGVECSYGTNACLEYATHSYGRQIAFSNASTAQF